MKPIIFVFLFHLFGSLTNGEIILIILGIITITVAIIFGIPVYKSWKSEKAKQVQRQKALFKGGGWIRTSDISFSILDRNRKMRNEQNPSYQEGVFESIRNLLNEKSENEKLNHILLVGPSLSGKSHITVSVLKSLNNAYVLLPDDITFESATKNGYEFPEVPINAKYKIILLDNFHEFFKGSSTTPAPLIKLAIEKKFTLWANCISIEEYERVKSSLDFKDISPFTVINLDKRLSIEEAKNICQSLGIKKLPACFNGLMGEIFDSPDDMIQHYGDIKNDAVAFDVLLFIKQAYMLGAFSLPYTMKFEFINKALLKKYPNESVSLMNALRKIERKGFIRLFDNHTSFSFESVWLNEIVEPQMKAKTFFHFWNDIIEKNVVYYTNLMTVSNNYSDAQLYYEEMIKNEIVPNLRTYTKLINLSPDYDTALSWYNKIKHIEADTVTFSYLIDKSPDYETAFYWFNKIENGKAGLRIYNYFINISPTYKEACEWYEKIEAGKANLCTFNSLINRSPNYKIALEWYEKIKPLKADLVTYNSLIDKSPNYITAFDWYKKIEVEKADLFTFNLLLDKSPDYRVAKIWYEKIINSGDANIVTYGSLINKSPDYKTALHWFNKINPAEINGIIYNSLICKSPDFETGMKLLQKMENDKLPLTVFTFGALFKLILKSFENNKFEKANALFDKMLKKKIYPNVIIYTLLIKLSPCFEQAFNFLELMITQKDNKGNIIKPNKRTKKEIKMKANGDTELLTKVEDWFREHLINRENI
jgi:pentatricopeptide repeat protein